MLGKSLSSSTLIYISCNDDICITSFCLMIMLLYEIIIMTLCSLYSTDMIMVNCCIFHSTGSMELGFNSKQVSVFHFVIHVTIFHLHFPFFNFSQACFRVNLFNLSVYQRSLLPPTHKIYIPLEKWVSSSSLLLAAICGESGASGRVMVQDIHHE